MSHRLYQPGIPGRQAGSRQPVNLKKLIEPVTTQGKGQYALNMRGLDEARAQGGHVSWAHFAAWPGLEGPLAIVLNKVHSVELLSTIEPFSEPTFAADVVPDLRMNSACGIDCSTAV
jgi:hypothetical protein